MTKRKEIRVEARKGLWANVVSVAAMIAICPLELIFHWTGRGLIIIAELLRELFYQIYFKELTK